MSAEITSYSSDPVRQFSIFTENRIGRLHDLAALFAEHDVHIVAVTALDTTHSTILRIVVDDPDRARELMINNDFPYTENDVLVVSIASEADLGKILAALFEAEINIHYLYSFIKRPGEKSALALHVEYPEEAARCLFLCGHTILGQRDIAR
ncbi:acetolactate synthase [Termitidicoccus mucosus]|uniref:Acetolactate synthase n=1 Tax=Termitidicoccus mucosus TaxID=1184151 RepID=A0A178IIB7_9BACT|nr:acetolactate synthase [Opitutaceae bacterium TSB47]